MQRWPEQARIIALLAVAIVSQATSNVLLSHGMKHVAGVGQADAETWLSVLLQAVRNPSILLGIGFLIIFFVLFATALSLADLSFVVPAISSEVVINVAFADYFLSETISPTRWLGAVLISIGVLLVLRSSPRTFRLAADPPRAVGGVGR
jgi:uncharacterized membrane protein